ncbi:MAG: peptidylprolyl isomerase [Acidobacteria bacterium]|nr:peptidylprolyl isomerase [Acidobacteriota bacterium]
MRSRILLAFVVAIFSLVSCRSGISPDEAQLVTPPKGPERYRVKFETTKGDFVVDAVRPWSPLGADRFHELVTSGFYENCRFFRVVPGFVLQFGIKGVPGTDMKWKKLAIDDDLPAVGNSTGTVTFATGGPRTRTTQVFINYKDNSQLDTRGFTPFGRVTEGMGVVMAINAEYAERPDQGKLSLEGNAYLDREFPRLDYIKKASIVP